jgi:hypothetical protein
MRIFVYKTIFLFFILFVFYKITIGSLINSFEKKFYYLASKENIELQKSLLRNKIEILINKDNILDEKDAELISKLISKIQREINK